MYESDDKMVSHPDHYKASNGMEVIDVIEAFTAELMGIEASDTANVIKYILRWKKKNGTQDLKKIMWYTQHLIDHLEKNTELPDKRHVCDSSCKYYCRCTQYKPPLRDCYIDKDGYSTGYEPIESNNHVIPLCAECKHKYDDRCLCKEICRQLSRYERKVNHE